MIFLDGGTGTELIAKGVSPCSLQDGTVVFERPETIRKIHKGYLRAGADIISTCTFMAQNAATATEINRAATAIAREAIADYRAESRSIRPILIAGSVGPTLGNHGDNIGPEIYIPQMTALIDSGVDTLLVETIVDPRYCRAAILAAKEAMTRCRRAVKVMLSASVNGPRGLLSCGLEVSAMLKDAVQLCQSLKIELPDGQTGFPLFSVGLNCSSGPEGLAGTLQKVAAVISDSNILLSAHPNAGLPDADGRYRLSPEQFAAEMSKIARCCPIDIAGGCCGTTPRHISELKSQISHIL